MQASADECEVEIVQVSGSSVGWIRACDYGTCRVSGCGLRVRGQTVARDRHHVRSACLRLEGAGILFSAQVTSLVTSVTDSAVNTACLVWFSSAEAYECAGAWHTLLHECSLSGRHVAGVGPFSFLSMHPTICSARDVQRVASATNRGAEALGVTDSAHLR